MKDVKYLGYDCVEFSITVTMNKRWIPCFLAMLKYMQRLGGVGASRSLSFFSDGDGDFRPKFEFDSNLPVAAQDLNEFEDRQYDAG
jgi:hypothetical protein